jgi:hypothetical protein
MAGFGQENAIALKPEESIEGLASIQRLDIAASRPPYHPRMVA